MSGCSSAHQVNSTGPILTRYIVVVRNFAVCYFSLPNPTKQSTERHIKSTCKINFKNILTNYVNVKNETTYINFINILVKTLSNYNL